MDKIKTIITQQLKKIPLFEKLNLDTIETKINFFLLELSRKLTKEQWKQIENYLMSNILFNNIINICIDDIKNIIRDGIISINDAPYILNMIKSIYSRIKELNEESNKIKIDKNTLIEICGVIIKIILCIYTKSEKELEQVLSITNSAIQLIEFNMDSTIKSICKCYS
jgi:hypothetical protein